MINLMLNSFRSSYFCRYQFITPATRRLPLLGISLLCFALFNLSLVNAGELSLLVNGKSYHFGPPKGTKYNENNWGGGIQYDYDAIKQHWVPFLTTSGFIDSFDEPSYYVGAGLVRRMRNSSNAKSMHFDAGLIGFIMKRDDYRKGDPFFGVLPAFSLGNDRFAVNATYIPKVDPKMVALWFFQLKISLENFK